MAEWIKATVVCPETCDGFALHLGDKLDDGTPSET
jgi:hypothetical protein